MLPLLIIPVLLCLLPLALAQTCQAAHNRIAVNGVCVCMDGFYDNGSQNCPSCNSLCLTCTSTSTTCTSCSSALHLTISGTTCICMDGYVMVAGVCQPCHYSCRTCSGLLSTNCLSCDPATRLFVGASNTCICLNTTYENTTLQSCQPCNIKCLWCTASTSNDCTACDSNLLRMMGASSPGPCLCYAGYYDSTPALCPQCSYTCATCTLSATTCLTCDSTNFRSLSGTSCSCIAHYFDSNTAICSECSPRCGNCSTTATTCLTCNNTLRRLVGTNCPCIDGYYENAATISCLPCTSYCLTCENSSSTCLSCYSYGQRALYNATCACITGYYDNGTINCQTCPYQCLGCTGPDPPVCTSCDPSAHRILSGGWCVCASGYYDNGITMCQPCSYSCQTCNLSPLMCTSCDASAHRTLIVSDCNCTVGYYDDGSNQMCASCHYSCISCFSGTNSSCFTCQINRNYTNYSCPCNVGMYELSQLCYNCDSSCATCTINATYCTACPSSRTLVNGTCVCSVGYYTAGLLCAACSLQCLTCSITSTSCLSCNVSQGTVLSGSSCICLDGYFKNTSTLSCQPCHYTCLTCISSSNTDCLTCNSSYNRALAVSLCPCNPGYFDWGAPSCLACHSHCTSCIGPSDYNCTACIPGYVLIGSFCRLNLTCLNYLYNGLCLNSCPDGTFGLASSSANLCLPCTNNCYTCATSTYCLSCVSGSFLDVSTHSCKSYCPIGYLLDPNQGCSPCPTQCTTCAYGITGILCTSCGAGYQIRDGGQCVLSCSTGYIAVAGRCHKCIGNCESCSSLAYNGCDTCKPGFYLLRGVCYTICPLGFTPTSNLCTPCPTQCSTCQSNMCLSCSHGYYLNSENECIAVGYFKDRNNETVACHPNCKTCSDRSFSSCLACSESRGDSSEFATSGYCECKSGSIDTGDGKCDVNVYEAVMRANEVLIGGTEAVLYMSVLTCVLAGNYVPLMGFIQYMQIYSVFFYLNSSAVMQTDLILEAYQNTNPMYYYRYRSSPPNSVARILMETQTDQSLFLRGRPWQYLIEWAFPTFLINSIIWALSICLICFSRKSNRVQNDTKQEQVPQVPSSGQAHNPKCSFKQIRDTLAAYAIRFKESYHESVAIAFFLLTYLEVSLFSAFSFKNLITVQMKDNSFSLNYAYFSLSIILSGYYIVYLIRILIGCSLRNLRSSLKEGGQNNPLKLLFHQFKPSINSRMSKAFVPLQLSRNVAIAVLTVALAYSPSYQAFSGLSALGIFFFINLCICPYKGIIRVYFHLYEFILIIQVGVLTYITVLPEKSRIQPSQALIILNFLQLLVIFLTLVWLAVATITAKLCWKKKIQKNSGNQQILGNQQSLAQLAEKDQYEKANEKQPFRQETLDNGLTVKPDISPYESTKTQQMQPHVGGTSASGPRSQKITKKYRIKHKI